MKVLLDVDTGVDDSIALLYALFNPEIEIVGISAVCGNVEAWLAAENTMKILDLAGAPDIPVAVGRRSHPAGNGTAGLPLYTAKTGWAMWNYLPAAAVQETWT